MLLVQRHPSPIVGRPGGLPGILWPCAVARLAGMGNGMKAPAQFSCAHVKGAHIAWRSRMSLRIAPADDDQVFVDDARCGQRDRLLFKISAELLAQVDTARLAERSDRLARLFVKAIEKIHHPGEDAAVLSIGPIGHSARRLSSADS